MSQTSNSEVARAIVKAISDLEFGEITITVHHSRVVKIEKVERIRLAGSPDASSRSVADDKGGGR